jgi:ABC-type phosphate/phosphonate transport system permease subunit
MRVQSGVWLDYDPGAVTVLVIGLCIVALAAVVALSISLLASPA